MKSYTTKILSFIILLSFSFNAIGQEWKKEFKELINDGISKAHNEPEKAIHSVLRAFEISKDQNDYWSVSNAKSAMGYISTVQRDYSAAFINYTEALDFIKKADTTDLPNEMVIHQNLGRIYKKYGSYDQAAQHYKNAHDIAIAYKKRFPKIFQDGKDGQLLIDFPYNQALALRDKGDYKASGEILLALWQQSETKKDTAAYARVLNQLGLIQKRAGDLREAEHYFGMVIGSEGIAPKMKAIALHNMGAMFLASAQYDKAQGYFDRAMALKTEHSNKRSQFITLLDMGELQYKTDRVEEAIDTWNKGLKIFSKVEGEPDLFEVYNWLQKAAIKTGSSQALAFNEQYASLNREWREEQQKQQAQTGLFALQSEVDALKLQKEQAYANRQLMKVYIPVAVGILLGVVALILILVRIRNARRKNAAIMEAEAVYNRLID